jgi:urease accessory protein
LDSKLALLYLASPTLPIGAFAYSQGLETAIDREIVGCKVSLEAWCRDAMTLGLARLDLSFLELLHDAIQSKDISQVDVLNKRVLASRETLELYNEEVNLGQSLKRLITTQGISVADMPLPDRPSFLLGFAYAAIALGLDDGDMKIAFLWSWLENQTAVACKAIPLGQSDAQALLLSLRSVIITLVKNNLEQDCPEGSLPGQALMSALHETQYSRLFRS